MMKNMMYATLILKNLACTGDQIQFVKLKTSESVISYESFQNSSDHVHVHRLNVQYC